MNRNLTSKAIVLKTNRVGDIHKGITFLTESFGLINAIAHGIYKGKSRIASLTDPFGYSLIHLYHNPVKNTYKVTDIEKIDIFEGIRNSLPKYYSASLWAEVILKSYGGGASLELFPNLLTALFCLDSIKDTDYSLLNIQFLWRYIELIGFKPEIDVCSRCGIRIDSKEVIRFSIKDPSFICSRCSSANMPVLSPGARCYLHFTSRLSFKESIKIGLDAVSIISLKNIILQMIQGIVDVPLNTLKGEDIFL